jgi:hypothetical protein
LAVRLPVCSIRLASAERTNSRKPTFNDRKEQYKMKVKTTICAAVIGVAMLSAGNAPAVEKWITGDWHQHSTFTDGSNIMGDLEIDKSTTPPTFTILKHKYTHASPDFAPVREGAAGKNEYKGVIPQGFRYGLDFQANSEHGGNRGARDGFGRYWVAIAPDLSFYPPAANIPLLGVNATYSNTCDFNNVDSPGCSSPAHKIMWRWQELFASVNPNVYISPFDWITTLRHQYPDKKILTGMEWNVPGHEHASSGCLENDGKCIAEFEYLFDRDDADTIGPASVAGLNWTGKILNANYTAANNYADYKATLGLNTYHNKAIDGLTWLNANHPNTSWVNPAHIERAGCGVWNSATSKWDNGGADGATRSVGYSMAALRDMNDTAPTVFFGFEGMPGHQKASNRGEVSGTSCGGGTFGGAGTYIATVSGVWDNLLADGRKIFNFVSSDFHMTQDDFYPGEYAKTYVKVKYGTEKDGDDDRKGKDDNEKGDHDRYTQQDILNAMRSGNSYAVHGDLIDRLDFKVVSQAHHGNKAATMGETLSVKKGDRVSVQIRFKSPTTPNNNGDIPVVHHVQLIQGRVNPTKAGKLENGLPNPAFNSVDQSVAGIVAAFDANSWTTDAHGYTTMTFNVGPVVGDMFFRIRGTNLGYGVNVVDASNKTIYGTDNTGSPLLNTPGTNSAAQAWKDLWFYSNPIFVKVLQER